MRRERLGAVAQDVRRVAISDQCEDVEFAAATQHTSGRAQITRLTTTAPHRAHVAPRRAESLTATRVRRSNPGGSSRPGTPGGTPRARRESRERAPCAYPCPGRDRGNTERCRG